MTSPLSAIDKCRDTLVVREWSPPWLQAPSSAVASTNPDTRSGDTMFSSGLVAPAAEPDRDGDQADADGGADPHPGQRESMPHRRITDSGELIAAHESHPDLVRV